MTHTSPRALRALTTSLLLTAAAMAGAASASAAGQPAVSGQPTAAVRPGAAGAAAMDFTEVHVWATGVNVRNAASGTPFETCKTFPSRQDCNTTRGIIPP